MPNVIDQKCWDFYLEGREERALRNDLSEAHIAAQVRKQSIASPREVIMAACEKVGELFDTGRVKRKWLADHGEEIKAQGCDGEKAYHAWMRGRIDELAYSVESNVLAEMAEEGSGSAAEAGYGEDDSDDDEDDSDDDDDDGKPVS